MSKDLEKEYRVLVNCEVPDLWARIETGLDDKDSSGIACKTKKKNIFSIKIWATVAAACVCVGLVIPVMRAHTGGMWESKGTGNDMAAAPQAAAESVEEGYDKEERFVTDNQAALFDAAGGAAENSVDSAADTAAMEAAFDGGDTAEITMASEPDVFLVKVEIVEVDVRKSSQIVYMAKVVESESLSLAENSEIRITEMMTDGAGEGLEKGSIYDLTLQKEDTEELSYRIVK